MIWFFFQNMYDKVNFCMAMWFLYNAGNSTIIDWYHVFMDSLMPWRFGSNLRIRNSEHVYRLHEQLGECCKTHLLIIQHWLKNGFYWCCQAVSLSLSQYDWGRLHLMIFKRSGMLQYACMFQFKKSSWHWWIKPFSLCEPMLTHWTEARSIFHQIAMCHHITNSASCNAFDDVWSG